MLLNIIKTYYLKFLVVINFYYIPDFVEIVNSLESALTVLESDEFDFKKYKKLVFDAGALLQRMKVGDK